MTYCHCKRCEIITKHQLCPESDRNVRGLYARGGRVYCEVCGTERWYAKAFGAGDFPELTHDENEIIHEARTKGFGSSFPAYPDAEAQARNTLNAAKKHLETIAALNTKEQP